MEELAQKELQDIRDFKTGSLRIGVSNHRGEKLLPKILPEMKQKYPQLKIELVEKRLRDLMKDLLEGRIDLMFGYVGDQPNDVAYEVYGQEQSALLVPETIWERCIPAEKRERLLGADKVLLEEFIDCPFILLNEGNWMNRQLKTYCARKNLTLNIELYTANVDTAVALACTGMGASVCPETYAREEYISGVRREPVYRFILDDPIFSPFHAIYYMKKRFLPKVAWDFIEIAKRNP